MESLDSVMGLTAATGLGLSDAADLVSTQLNIFSDSGLSAQKAVDLLAKTANSSAQDIFNLREAVKTSSQVAQAFGIDFDELTVILGSMANAGIRGEQAGTALSAALARLANPTAAVVEKLDELGVSIDEVNPLTNEFGDILDTIRDSGANASEILEILGEEAGRKFPQLIKNGSQGLEEFAKRQAEANDASTSANEKLNTLSGDIDLLTSATKSYATSVFEDMEPALRAIVKATTAVINAVNESNRISPPLGRLAEIREANKVINQTEKEIKELDQAILSLNQGAQGEGQKFLQAMPDLTFGPKQMKEEFQKVNEILDQTDKKLKDIKDSNN